MNGKTVFFRLFLLLVLLNIPRAFADDGSRATWVWASDTRTILNDSSAAQSFFDFAAAKNIETVYLHADFLKNNEIVQHPDHYQSFIANAHDRGIKIQALVGSRYYTLSDDANRANALAVISTILNYNNSSSSNQRFDGFNVDVEPYMLPDWENQQLNYSLQFLDMLSKQKELVDQSGQNLTFGPCIPRWYDTSSPPLNVTWDGQEKPLLEHILDISDYVAIMDYRNTASSIVSGALSELNYADGIGKKVVVGVETNNVQPSNTTFFGFTEAQMEEILASTEDSLVTHESFDGYAIHHYGSYSAMAPIPEPSTTVALLLGGIGISGFLLKQRKRFAVLILCFSFFANLFAEPAMTVSDQFDFGFTSLGDQVTHDFILFNATDETIYLKKVSTTCDCTKILFSPEKVEPKSSGRLSVLFQPLNAGIADTKIDVEVVGLEKPFKTFTMSGIVQDTLTAVQKTQWMALKDPSPKRPLPVPSDTSPFKPVKN